MTGFLSWLLRLGAGGGEGVLVGDICRHLGADWFLRPVGCQPLRHMSAVTARGFRMLALCYSAWVVAVVGWLVMG